MTCRAPGCPNEPHLSTLVGLCQPCWYEGVPLPLRQRVQRVAATQRKLPAALELEAIAAVPTRHPAAADDQPNHHQEIPV
jgi:hypothetical protein